MPPKPEATRWCAVYTRKSSEAGLEQDFNSLDAQREAGEAYIASQKHEGWRVLKESYDDGGFSGGSMERPGLQRLMDDIRAGRIQVVVVYKVDRLTRSLADFAKLIEVFDAHGVSFVSVTQQFNTTTSMGRLTLNVLLSFAQFEREVTGERIRDKFLASRRKGMWMGGNPPLGYDIKDRRLVVNEAEAELVRYMFRRFVEIKSANGLRDELNRDGHRTKQWTSATGRAMGGKPFWRGHIYHVLKSRVYLGEAVHKSIAYPGEHTAIVPPELWNAVEEALAANRRARTHGRPFAHPSLLRGLLYDDAGNRMNPTHAKKQERRYRYYVSQAVQQGELEKAGQVTRVPAHDLEKLVLDAVFPERKLEEPAPDKTTVERRVQRVEVTGGLALIQLVSSGDGEAEQRLLRVNAPFLLTTAQKAGNLDLLGEATARSSATISKSLARAWAWRRALENGTAETLRDFAQSEGVTTRYVSRVLRLAFLQPRALASIVAGKSTARIEAVRSALPSTWTAQIHISPNT